MLRANSKLRKCLNNGQVDFLKTAVGAFQRLLPHVHVESWNENSWEQTRAVSASGGKTEVRVAIAIGANTAPNSGALTTTIRRRGATNGSLDLREYAICQLIVHRIAEVLAQHLPDSNLASIRAITRAFDEHVVASYIQTQHGLGAPVSSVLSALHKLSEQSYENKSLTFGCILDPHNAGADVSTRFPDDFLQSKKYKALSDGFRTAYVVSTDGQLLNFVDLEKYGKEPVTEKHYFPEWAEALARSSRKGRCGISLSRQGDILVFDEGTLRLTYRYGQWRYWNHVHLLDLLRYQARVQGVPKKLIGRVVGAIYRASLDVSFRRSGGLFVILHSRNLLRKVAKQGDAIGDKKRSGTDKEFDQFLAGHTMQSLPRSVTVELASLDGAVVLENSGRILAYGAILQPRRAGNLHGSEGSRTKAAIGASNYGLAVKISSDGEIAVYTNGAEFIRV